MFSLVLAGIILTLVCVWIAWKRIKFCLVMSAIPGPKAWPIVGNTLQFKRESHGKSIYIVLLL